MFVIVRPDHKKMKKNFYAPEAQACVWQCLQYIGHYLGNSRTLVFKKTPDFCYIHPALLPNVSCEEAKPSTKQ